METRIYYLPPQKFCLKVEVNDRFMDELKQLQSSDVSERAAAAEALSLLGPDAKVAAVELVKACGDDETVSEYAVAALEQLGPPPPESLPLLATMIASESPLTSYWAITLIGRSGVAAKSCQDQLTAAVDSSGEPSLQERSAWALGKINADSAGAIEALEKASRSSNARLARLATASLDQIQT